MRKRFTHKTCEGKHSETITDAAQRISARHRVQQFVT
jgi:hypothetical protein